jgi:hypothetical protein
LTYLNAQGVKPEAGPRPLRSLNLKRLAVLAAIGATVLVAQSFIAFADDVPTFDIQKACNARAQGIQGTAAPTGCVTDEQNARATLVNQWSQFAPKSKAECLQIQGDGAAPRSYVELLTCLQMAKQIKELPKD